MSSEVSIKQSLRKIEYPQCAHEALLKIRELTSARIVNIKTMDFALDLMAEFVFYEVDRRGQRRSQPLTPLLELELIRVIYEFFANTADESVRNALFLSLFSGTAANQRAPILIKFVSLAIGIPSANILCAASAWMQQLGNTSANCCRFADGLCSDYFGLYGGARIADKIAGLPQISAPFTANFITAVAENYFCAQSGAVRKEMLFPPENLMRTIADWISHDRRLCTAAQHTQPTLPPGAIAMEATTPIAGLLRWCVLAPIYRQTSDVYADLHLALLESLKEAPPKAVYALHLTTSINPLLAYVHDLKNRQDKKLDAILAEDALQLALDRYAQGVQVCQAVGAVYGQVEELFHQLKILPFNKLMSIVIRNYQNSKVIVL